MDCFQAKQGVKSREVTTDQKNQNKSKYSQFTGGIIHLFFTKMKIEWT